MHASAEFDLAVIGAGIGGLAAAALAQRVGLRVALLEAHTRLGGCAGWFSRGPCTFDVGATALMGLGPGEPLGDLLRVVGLAFRGAPTAAYRVCLPDRSVAIVPDAAAFERNILAAFPRRPRAYQTFWRWQARVGETLFQAAARVPRLPLGGVGDLVHDVRVLGLPGTLAGLTSAVTVRHVLRLLGLDSDVPFRSLIAMLLQDTAQADPETVPFANAAACLQAYRRGMSRPRGGMRALADGLGERFAALGGDLRTATLVDGVAPDARGGFLVATRRCGRSVRARDVVFNLPLDRAAALLGRSLEGRLGRCERRSRAAWSACTAYLAIDRAAVPDDAPLFHQVLQHYDRPIHDGNNVLVSLAPPDDAGYGPPGVRVATLSTHTRPADWFGLDGAAYDARKQTYRDRLTAALARALPDAPAGLVHAEFGTPRSFARYTRRALGAVGGPPAARTNTNFFAVGPDVFGPGLWVVGDSVFPGQGTMATVLSAVRVVERLTGVSWNDIRAREPLDAPWPDVVASSRSS
jgi:C-3',4' desaturase CrtD